MEQRLRERLPHLFLAAAAEAQPPLPPPLPPSASLSSLIDHTLLKPDASTAEVEKLCAEAVRHRFAAVCVNGQQLATAVRCLRRPEPGDGNAAASVRIAAVCAFPLGASLSSVKVQEARALQAAGADEVDVVCSQGWLREEALSAFHAELAAVVAACRPACVKVILETAALPAAAIVDGCLLAALAGCGFVKTSSGLHAAGGAEPQAVSLMRAVVGSDCGIGVKASGGIRDWQTAAAMVAAGASRIGTSSGVAIVTAEHQRRTADAGDDSAAAAALHRPY